MKKIAHAIELGATFQIAANYGGVAYNTLNEWKHRGLAEAERRGGDVPEGDEVWIREQQYYDLYEVLLEAEGVGAVKWHTSIEKAAAGGNWQAAAWKLERRYHQDYGRVRLEHTGADGGAIEQKIIVTISDD